MVLKSKLDGNTFRVITITNLRNLPEIGNMLSIKLKSEIINQSILQSYMKVMGLSQWMLWLSYLISNFIKLSINVIILSVLYYVITPKTTPTLAFVLFTLYAFNAIYVAFAASAFLHSGKSFS